MKIRQTLDRDQARETERVKIKAKKVKLREEEK